MKCAICPDKKCYAGKNCTKTELEAIKELSKHSISVTNFLYFSTTIWCRPAIGSPTQSVCGPSAVAPRPA
jgi:hypothetical protein